MGAEIFNHFPLYQVKGNTKYSKGQITEPTQKTERSFTSLKLFREIISLIEHSHLTAANRHNAEGLGRVGSNKPLFVYDTL